LVSPEILQTIAQHTNENEAIQHQAKEHHTPTERNWNDITGVSVGAFIGTNMMMGVYKAPSVEDYWNTSIDKPIFPHQQYVSREWYEQVSRYFKVNSPTEDVGDQFWRRVEPLMSSFRDASQRLVKLGETVSIDENLIASSNRSGDLIQIDNKAAGKGYKLYTLALHYYLYDWMYTSKKTQVPQAKNYVPQATGYEDDAFTDTERMVLTLVEELLQNHPGVKFTVVFDNFFTSTRLFHELREWGVGAYGTAKAGSGMPKPHILINKVATREQDYGEIVNSVGRGINYCTYIDNGAVWMMSTVHDVANDPVCWRGIAKRPKASQHLSQVSVDGSINLPFPQISYDYNHHMNGSDLCQQMWNKYTTSVHCHRRIWWPLFWQIIDASIANVLFIYRLKGYTKADITHQQLQERLGLQLLRNPSAVCRKRASMSIATTPRPTSIPTLAGKHTWIKSTRRWCVVCRRRKAGPPRTRGPGWKKRATLQELGINVRTRTPLTQSGKRKRGAKTSYACLECDVAVCKSDWCWQRHHGEIEIDDESEASEPEVEGTDLI
jgi:hypothetical protein